jgi:hypothetical protein
MNNPPFILDPVVRAERTKVLAKGNVEIKPCSLEVLRERWLVWEHTEPSPLPCN